MVNAPGAPPSMPFPLAVICTSVTGVTLTTACWGVVDIPPRLSLATTLKAFNGPFAPLAGRQYALLSASITWPPFHTPAVALDAPIRKVPLVSSVTLNEVSVPSTSAALLCASKVAKLMTTSPSSAPLANGAFKLVSVGKSLTAMPLTVLIPITAGATPSETLVAIVKLLLKLALGVKVTPASKVFTLAVAPLAVQTPVLAL